MKVVNKKGNFVSINEKGMIACFFFGIGFTILSIVFALLKEKATVLISGFNFFTKEKREQYNTKQMSKDTRNRFFVWAVLWFVGGLLSYFFNIYFIIVIFVIWFIFVVKEIRLDANKAFEKYKL